jgi:hypothetical protein
MKAKQTLWLLTPAFAGIAILLTASAARGGATIDPTVTNRYAYGANIGWMDWYADGLNGAVVNDYYCTGCVYAANVGWISLGSGVPSNGIRYQNLSAADYGVNNDGVGNLGGYAWGANVGWIVFENTGAPKVDLVTGQFSGYAWSANCGWICLSNAVAVVKADHILPGPLAANALPVPWLLTYFGTTAVDPNADADGDGVSNAQEYWAGTNPRDRNDQLYISSIVRGHAGNPSYVALYWTAKNTRLYRLERKTDLNPVAPWIQYVTGFESLLGWSSVGFDDTLSQRYYRVEAVRPLP